MNECMNIAAVWEGYHSTVNNPTILVAPVQLQLMLKHNVRELKQGCCIDLGDILVV